MSWWTVLLLAFAGGVLGGGLWLAILVGVVVATKSRFKRRTP